MAVFYAAAGQAAAASVAIPTRVGWVPSVVAGAALGLNGAIWMGVREGRAQERRRAEEAGRPPSASADRDGPAM